MCACPQGPEGEFVLEGDKWKQDICRRQMIMAVTSSLICCAWERDGWGAEDGMEPFVPNAFSRPQGTNGQRDCCHHCYQALTVEELRSLMETVPDGSTIILAKTEEEYVLESTLVVARPMTLSGVPGTVLTLRTEKPYQNVIQCSGSSIRIQNLTIRHYSPSIANNYAVYLLNCDDTDADQLDVRSDTGTGICIEGGQRVTISHCTAHDCAKNGISVFSDIDGEDSGVILVQDTTVKKNKKHGILVQSAGPEILRNTVTGNVAYGLYASNAFPTLRDNVIEGNGQGAIGKDGNSLLL